MLEKMARGRGVGFPQWLGGVHANAWSQQIEQNFKPKVCMFKLFLHVTYSPDSVENMLACLRNEYVNLKQKGLKMSAI